MTELRLHKGPLSFFLVAVLAVGTVACGDDSDDGDGTGATGSGSSSSATSGNGGSGAGPADIPDFNGCTTSDYVDLSAEAADRTIEIAPSGALEYAPKCSIVGAGQAVTFSGSLLAHPTAPGNPNDPAAGEYGGTSPIVETTSGDSLEVTFSAAGTYPYFCKFHSFGDGEGMAGVVHVQ